MDWLKKIIESPDNIPSEEEIINSINEAANNIDNEEAYNRPLILSPNVYLKFGPDGKIMIQNVNSDAAVEFTKDVLLVLYDFFNPANDGLKVNDFLQNWPIDSHNELKRSINILTGSEILVEPARAEELTTDDTPQAPTPEKNIHINLINHHYMLKDYVRLAAYRRAIENNVKPGSIAMDLGTGTGILAFFAAKAGAKKVYAIEKRTDMVNLSKQMAEENQIDDKIEYLIGNSAKLNPDQFEEKVDVFISEILGSGIFEENVLEYTMDARDRFCKPDAALIPCKLDVYAFGYDAGRNDDLSQEATEVERMYDLKLSKYKENLVNFINARYERYNTSIYQAVTNQLLTKSLDLKTLQKSMFRDELEFEVTENGNFNAICVYFVAHLDENTTLTNSPWAPSTHWIQKVFVMPQSLKVSKGQKIPISSIYDGDYRVELRV
jgi:SAM-dependent methyltransferase